MFAPTKTKNAMINNATTEAVKAKFPRFNQPWKRADMDYVRNLFGMGVRIPEIATMAQRTERAVRLKLMGMGEINGYLCRDGQAWLPSEDDRMLRFVSQDYTVPQIATLMGRRKLDIRRRLRFLSEEP